MLLFFSKVAALRQVLGSLKCLSRECKPPVINSFPLAASSHFPEVFLWPVLSAFVPGDGMSEPPLAHVPDTLHGTKTSESQGQTLTEPERRQIVL